MASIDERVVSMAFENSVFEQRIAQTMSSLNKLDTTLKQVGANQSLGDIEKSANKVTLEKPMSAMDRLRAKFSRGTETKSIEDIEKAGNKVTLEQPVKAVDNLQRKLDKGIDAKAIQDLEKVGSGLTFDGVGRAIDGLSNKFSALQVAAGVAIGNIATQLTTRIGGALKSFSLGPITQGFEEYQTNLNSIQTILANTEGQKVSGLDEVNKHLQDLNKYSDKTIYNFSQMAKNIGTFTAAGVDLDTSTQSIKGIANLAALSGSSAEQASGAMYQLSQAIAAGRVGLQDWNSVVNAGMGGAKFQQALMRTADNMGSLEKGALKIDKATGKATINGESFRESIMAKPGQQSWLTSDVLTNTLKQFTGDMTDAQLKAEGFSDSQIKMIQQQAQTAQKAATEVKTLSGVFTTVRESIGSGWSQTFQLIFGDFNESKKLFTGITTFITDWVGKVSDARNKMLDDWKKLGGRDDLLAGLKAGFQAFLAIVKPIKDAFRDIFPSTTGRQLAGMSENFRKFMENLRPGSQIVEGIKRTFRGLFAILHIGFSIVKGVAGVIGDLLGVVGKGSGGFLNFTGGIGDFLVAIDKALTKGGLLEGFFNGLTSILKAPLSLISGIASAFLDLFGSGDRAEEFTGKVGDGMSKVGAAISPIDNVLNRAKEAWQNFLNILQKVGDFLQPYVDQIKELFSNIGNVIADAFSSANFDRTLDVIKTVLMGGLFLQLKKLVKGGFGVDFGGGALEKLGKTFDALTGHLQTMQKSVQASILLKIAGALALLAASAFVFSTIEPKRLTQAMGAMAVGLGQLVGAMALLTKTAGAGGFIQVPAMAAGMVLLAGAVLVLAAAVKIFSTMSWEDLARGLAGVAGSLVAIGLGMKLLGPGTLIQAAPLIAIAVALNLLGLAVKQFASLSWEDLGKGLLGVAGALGVIGAAMLLFGPSTLLVGPGLIAVSFAMTILAGAVAAFGALDLATIAKGVGGLAAALAAIALSLFLIPPTAALQGAGLVVVAAGLSALGGALAIIGGLKIATLVKGLTAMAAALVVLSVGLTLMAGTLPGSLALLAAAAAFAILGPAMALIGNLDWSTILKALAAMALTLGVLAIVGALAAAPLIQLGLALGVLGIGLLAITAPIYLFAKAISLLSDVGQKGVAAFLLALTAFIAILPKIVIDFVKGLVEILTSIVELAPKIITQLGKILDMIIQFVIAKAPALAVAVGTLIGSFLTVVDSQGPNIINSGVKLILGFLSGISNNISKVVTKASEIVRKFLDGLTQNAPGLVASGLKAMLSFLSGISNGIPRIVTKVAEMVTKFLAAVTTRIPGIIARGASMIAAILDGISSNIGRVVNAGASLIVKFMGGIAEKIPEVVQAGLRLARRFLNGLADGLSGLADAGFKAVIRFMNGIADAIRNNSDALIDAGANILDALVDGMSQAAGRAGPVIKKAITGLFGMLPGWAKKILGIHSPSAVFAEIGRFTMQGFKEGMEEYREPVKKSAIGIGNGMIGAFKGLLQIRSPSQVLKDIGKEVGRGFKDGLDGSAQDIRESFRSLNEKITDELRNARQSRREEHKRLEDLEQQHADKLAEIQDLRRHPRRNAEEIKAANAELKDINQQINESERAIARYDEVIRGTSAAHSLLTGSLKAEKDQLVGMSKDLDTVTQNLDKAQAELDKIKQARADFITSTQQQYSQLPDEGKLLADALAEADMTAEEVAEKRRKKAEEDEKRRKINQVANYKKALAEQIEATKTYQATLQKLRELGLDDATYKKLLARGVEGQEFATQLAATGKQGVAELNKLDSDLTAVSTGLAEQSAGNLYDAGVNAAQGLVDGLTAKKKEIEAAMSVIADAIVARIKSALGIRSPSRVLAEVGKFLMDGLAKGVQDNQNGVDSSLRTAAQKAVDAARDAFGAVDMGSIMDVEPTITPVLDLGQVQKDADKLGAITNVTPITAAASFGQAAAISADQQAREAALAAAGGGTVTQVEFNQYNTSPESLSDTEIYRQTNNQLSQLRSALGLTSANKS